MLTTIRELIVALAITGFMFISPAPAQLRVCETAVPLTSEGKLDQMQAPCSVLRSGAMGPGGLATASASIWKAISLGTFGNTYALFDALDSANIHIGEAADEILHRPAFTISKVKFDVELVILSGTQLGFGEEGGSLAELYARSRQLGLELGTPEIAAQLRLQYADQPVGEFLDIAMEPLSTYEGELIGLTVANGGAGLLLIGHSGGPETIASQSTRFVFVRPVRVSMPSNR
jgi:hypothetical protein